MWHTVNDAAQSTLASGLVNGFVCFEIGRVSIHSVAVMKLVVDGFIKHFVVLAGRFYVVVINFGIFVKAPLGVYRDNGIAAFGRFGGDKDNAIGAACTVKRVRCGIFQHADALYIGGIDVAVIARIGKSVDNDERPVAGIERTDAADLDGGRRRRTVSFDHLYARNLAVKGRQGVVHLSLGYLVGIKNAGRTSERLALLLTESHHDNVVDLFRIRLHDDAHLGLDGCRYRVHTDVRND